MKIILGLAVIAVLAALATNWARDKGETLLHHTFDAALPGKVDGHVWTPVEHGHGVPADKVRFIDGQVTTVRCHGSLGTFSVRVDHGFSFTPTNTRIRKGCPGRSLRSSLETATRVDVDEHGTRLRLRFSDADHDNLATLTSRGA